MENLPTVLKTNILEALGDKDLGQISQTNKAFHFKTKDKLKEIKPQVIKKIQREIVGLFNERLVGKQMRCITLLNILPNENINDEIDSNGRSLLYAACMSCNFFAAELIIQKGGDVKFVDQTVLKQILDNNDLIDMVDLKYHIIEFLLEHNANPYLGQHFNVEESFRYVHTWHFEDFTFNHNYNDIGKFIALFVKYGYDVNKIVDDDDYTFLEEVILFGGDMNYYLRDNTDVDYINPILETTPLTFSLQENDKYDDPKDFKIDPFQILLKHGADPNLADGNGKLPLLLAVSTSNPPATKLLLQHGANPNLACENGHTPLSIAQTQHNEEIISILLEHGAKK